MDGEFFDVVYQASSEKGCTVFAFKAQIQRYATYSESMLGVMCHSARTG